MRFALTLLAALAAPVASEFEWAGTFELHEGETYTWIAQKVDGDYADASMKIVILETDDCDEEGIEAVEADAETMLDGDCTDVANGETYSPGACYRLVFDGDVDTTTYSIDIPAERRRLEDHDHGHCFAIFTEHVPVEFEFDTHYLQDDAGANMEPVAEEGGGGAHSHGHGGGSPVEWAGTFELVHGESYAWTAQKAGGDCAGYADCTMMLAIIEVEDDSAEELEAAMASAEALFESDDGCPDLANGGALTMGACSTLIFDQEVYSSIWDLAVPADRRRLEDHDHGDHGFFVFAAQHFPTEFELDSHYLKDDLGTDVEPLLESTSLEAGGGGSGDNKRGYAWRNSMFATFIVLLCTFVGALTRLTFKDAVVRAQAIIPFASALGAGALLGCALFLMLVEATHLIGARWAEEVQSTWRWGVAVLGGYLLGLVTEIIFPRAEKAAAKAALAAGDKEASTELTRVDDKEGGASAAEVEMSFAPPDYAFAFNVFFGDFWHNLVDGIVIANSFLNCESGKGWVVAAATIYHELVQEFGDFFLLVGPGGLTVVQAVALNFFSGISVMFGAMIYLWTKPGMGTEGILLAFSGGIYTYVACTDAAGEVLNGVIKLSPAKRMGLLACFAVGAIGIGLVLLDHEHCSPKDDGSGGGHGHGH